MSIPPLDKFGYIRALRGADLTLAEFRVLVTVWDYSDEHGRHAYASIARLAADCEVSERTVRRCLVDLVAKGFLRRVRRGHRDGAGNPWASEYELRLLARPPQPVADDSQPATSGQFRKVSTGHLNRPGMSGDLLL
jgi:DNA-binding transcriptional regulator PaaX